MASKEEYFSLGFSDRETFFHWYSMKFIAPTCQGFEGQWNRLMKRFPQTDQGIMRHGDTIVAIVTQLPVYCLSEWEMVKEGELLPVAVCNPGINPKVRELFGVTNALFAYGESLYAGVFGEGNVYCVRPVVAWRQEDLREPFRMLVESMR